jgi:hypothetical protein
VLAAVLVALEVLGVVVVLMAQLFVLAAQEHLGKEMQGALMQQAQITQIHFHQEEAAALAQLVERVQQ